MEIGEGICVEAVVQLTSFLLPLAVNCLLGCLHYVGPSQSDAHTLYTLRVQLTPKH